MVDINNIEQDRKKAQEDDINEARFNFGVNKVASIIAKIEYLEGEQIQKSMEKMQAVHYDITRDDNGKIESIMPVVDIHEKLVQELEELINSSLTDFAGRLAVTANDAKAASRNLDQNRQNRRDERRQRREEKRAHEINQISGTLNLAGDPDTVERVNQLLSQFRDARSDLTVDEMHELEQLCTPHLDSANSEKLHAHVNSAIEERKMKIAASKWANIDYSSDFMLDAQSGINSFLSDRNVGEQAISNAQRIMTQDASVETLRTYLKEKMIEEGVEPERYGIQGIESIAEKYLFGLIVDQPEFLNKVFSQHPDGSRCFSDTTIADIKNEIDDEIEYLNTVIHRYNNHFDNVVNNEVRLIQSAQNRVQHNESLVQRCENMTTQLMSIACSALSSPRESMSQDSAPPTPLVSSISSSGQRQQINPGTPDNKATPRESTEQQTSRRSRFAPTPPKS